MDKYLYKEVMLSEDHQQHDPFCYRISESQHSGTKSIHLDISPQLHSELQLIEKQTLLIKRLKEDKNKLIAIVEQKNKLAFDMLGQMKNYEAKIEFLQRREQAMTSATQEKSMRLSNHSEFDKNPMLQPLKEENEKLEKTIRELKQKINQLQRQKQQSQIALHSQISQLKLKFEQSQVYKELKQQQLANDKVHTENDDKNNQVLINKTKGQFKEIDKQTNNFDNKLQTHSNIIIKSNELEKERKQEYQNDETHKGILENLRRKIEEKDGKINELQSKISDLLMEITFKQKQLRDKDEEKKFLLADVNSFKEQLIKVEAQTQSKLNKKKKKEYDMESHHQNVIADLEKQISQLKEKLQEIQKKTEKVSLKYQSAEIGVLTIQSNQNIITTQAYTKQKERVVAKSQQQDDETKVRNIENCEKVNEEGEEQDKDQILNSSSLQLKLKELHEKLCQIQMQVVFKDKEIRDLREQMTYLRKDSETFKGQLNKSVESSIHQNRNGNKHHFNEDFSISTVKKDEGSQLEPDYAIKNSQLQKKVIELEGKLNVLKEQITDKSKEIQEKQNSFDLEREQIIKKESQNISLITLLEQEKLNLEQQIKIQSHLIRQLQETIKTKDDDISSLKHKLEFQIEQKVSVQSQKITEMVRQSSKKEKNIKQLMKSLDRLTEQKNTLVERLTEEENKFELYHKNLEQQKSQLSEYLETRDDEIQRLKEKLAKKTEVVEQLEQKIQSLNESVNFLREQSDEVLKLYTAQQQMDESKEATPLEKSENNDIDSISSQQKINILHQNLIQKQQMLKVSDKKSLKMISILKKISNFVGYEWNEQKIFGKEEEDYIFVQEFLRLAEAKGKQHIQIRQSQQNNQDNVEQIALQSAIKQASLKQQNSNSKEPQNKAQIIQQQLNNGEIAQNKPQTDKTQQMAQQAGQKNEQIKKTNNYFYRQSQSTNYHFSQLPIFNSQPNQQGKQLNLQPITVVEENLLVAQDGNEEKQMTNLRQKDSQYPEPEFRSSQPKDMKISFPMLLCRNEIPHQINKLEIKPFLARVQPYQAQFSEIIMKSTLKALEKDTLIGIMKQVIHKLNNLTTSMQENTQIDDLQYSEIISSIGSQPFRELLHRMEI